MLFWIAIAYAISTPFAIWIHIATPVDDCVEERLHAKASRNFTSVAWMFDAVFSVYHLCWAILIGPLVVGLCAIAFPFLLVYEVIRGGQPDGTGENAADPSAG